MGPQHVRPAGPQLSAARATVLRALTEASDAVTVVTVAGTLGQHPNTVREHLDALVTDGHVERTRSTPSGRGRPAWLYRAATSVADDADDATAGPADYAGHEYLALAMALVDQVATSNPHPRALARQAGERWGRSLAEHRTAAVTTDDRTPDGSLPNSTRASETVTDILRDLRFTPQPASDTGKPGKAGKTLRLTTCPFLDAARRNPDVVCQVHAGIVRGALQHAGADPDSAQLREFAEPGACLLHLDQPSAGPSQPAHPGIRTGDE